MTIISIEYRVGHTILAPSPKDYSHVLEKYIINYKYKELKGKVKIELVRDA